MDGKRMIEDYLPIKALSAEACREEQCRKKGQPIRLTTNEWYKAQQLGNSFWLYVVWNPLNNPDAVPVMIQNPAKHLEHAAKPVVSARFYDIPAEAIESASRSRDERRTTGETTQ